jgi:tetratricopeptide (TPR) repeat protein
MALSSPDTAFFLFSTKTISCNLELLYMDRIAAKPSAPSGAIVDKTPKYRAFLCYSHADAGAARRVRHRLEGFCIDRELVGHITRLGPVPATLRPIFRKRFFFDSSPLVGAATIAALDNSAALVLLASPGSARSKYVDSQVRLFKSRHPDRPVIPLIVDGTPDDPEIGCFPPALRFAVVPDGAESPADMVPPDLRNRGDGFDLAIAKVVARMTGLSPHNLYHRAERKRNLQDRLRARVAAASVMLAIAAGAFFWQAQQQKAARAEVSALVHKYDRLGPTQAADPGARESLTQAITAIADGAVTDKRYASALALLKVGRFAEAEPLLQAVAQDKAKRSAKDAAAADRTLASIAAVSEPGRAREYYAQAARLDPSDIEGMFRNGWFQYQAGQLDAADASYRRVIASATASNNEWVHWALLGKGDIERERGRLDDALATYRKGGAIAENLAKADPGNTGWHYDIGISDERIGDLLMALGNRAQALKSYNAQQEVISHLAKGDPGNAERKHEPAYVNISSVTANGAVPDMLASYQASVAIMDRLAKTDPGNAGLRRDLAASYDRAGNMLLARNDLAGALESYSAGLAIMDRLTKGDPGNAGWQRDLAAAYAKVGDVMADQDDLPDALNYYQAGLAIADRLAKADPGNARWQRDLAVTYGKAGDLLAEQGNLAKALKFYRASLAIADRLVMADTAKAAWQRDLSMTYNGIGGVLKTQGDLAEALKSYQASLAILDRLTKVDPGNAGWQHDLAVTYDGVGEVLKARGDFPEALNSFSASLAILDRLVAGEPGNTNWQRDLAVTHSGIGDVLKTQGNLPEALKSFYASLAIAEPLAEADAAKPELQRDIAVTYVRLADFYRKSGQGPKAQESLAAARAVMARLVAKFPHQALWKQDFAWFAQQIAVLTK